MGWLIGVGEFFFLGGFLGGGGGWGLIVGTDLELEMAVFTQTWDIFAREVLGIANSGESSPHFLGSKAVNETPSPTFPSTKSFTPYPSSVRCAHAFLYLERENPSGGLERVD